MRASSRCSAISTTRASRSTACARASFARTASSSSRPTAPDGKLAAFEVKYTFGLDPLQQYLVEFPDGRLQALSIAWDSRPRRRGGQRWFHLYPNETIRHDDALHWTKLNQNWNFMCAECHSMGVRKNYDAASRPLRHDVGRNQRRLRGVPRPGLAPRGLGARTAELVAVRQDRRSGPWAAGALRRAARRRLGRRCADRQRHAQPRTADAAHRGRDLRAVPRPARPALREPGCRDDRCRKRTRCRRLAAGSITPTGRCSTRSTTTVRSSRAGCSRPASPAATATSRTAPSCAPPATASACNATRRTSTPPPRTTVTSDADPALDLRVVPHAAAHLHGRRPAARPQLPHPASRSVGRSSARPTPATTATPTSLPNGRRPRSSAGTGPTARASRRTRRRSMRHGPGGADAATAARRDRVGSQGAGDRACERADRARAAPLARQHRVWRARASPIPIRWCASARSTCWRARPRPGSGRWCLRCSRIRCSGVRIRAVSLLAGVPQPNSRAQDRERFERAAAEFVAAQTLNADRPEARTSLGNFCARRAQPRSRSRIPGGAAPQPAIRARGGEPGRSLPATRARCRWRGSVASRRIVAVAARCGVAPRARL